MKRPKHRRATEKKFNKDIYPQGIIDIIKADYPDRYSGLSEDLETLFSEEEWLDILSKSRLSYKKWLRLRKLGIIN